MKRVVLALAAVVCLHAQGDLAGDWQGTLDVGGTSLRLVVHFVKVEGGLGGTLDSLDQGAYGLKLGSVRLDGKTLRFTLERPAAEFEGEWNPQSGEFRGEWRQSGNALPLTLKRVGRPSPPKLLVDNRRLPGAYS